MNKIIKNTKNKIFYINPKIVKYCIYPSKFCDYTHAGISKLNPHAGNNRGVFRENLSGYTRINSSGWDFKPGILFSKIFEYLALFNHFKGKENWKKSRYADRCVKFIKQKKGIRGFKDPKIFLEEREKQIDKLFHSMMVKGLKPNTFQREKNAFVDNVSLALTKKNELFFNNRGHHRLSIAKILRLKKIPIKITVVKSEELLNRFTLKLSNLKK